MHDDPFAYCGAIGTVDEPDVATVNHFNPPGFRETVGKAFDVPDVEAFRDMGPTVQWRCVDGEVLACIPGATGVTCSQPPEGLEPTPEMIAFCEDQPDGTMVSGPGTQLGRETIYNWECRDGTPVIVSTEFELDERGFIEEYWRTIPAP